MPEAGTVVEFVIQCIPLRREACAVSFAKDNDQGAPRRNCRALWRGCSESGYGLRRRNALPLRLHTFKGMREAALVSATGITVENAFGDHAIDDSLRLA